MILLWVTERKVILVRVTWRREHMEIVLFVGPIQNQLSLNPEAQRKDGIPSDAFVMLAVRLFDICPSRMPSLDGVEK